MAFEPLEAAWLKTLSPPEASPTASPQAQLIRDLDLIFQVALSEGKLSVALRAKELWAKAQDLWPQRKPSPPGASSLGESPETALQALSDAALDQLIALCAGSHAEGEPLVV